VRLTNNSVPDPIGVGTSRYQLDQNGIVQTADEPFNPAPPCDEAISVAMGSSYECDIAFTVSTADGAPAILLYSDPMTGAETEVQLEQVPSNGAYDACEMLHGNVECIECAVYTQGDCTEAYSDWTSRCDNCGPFEECCPVMDLTEDCLFGPELNACIQGCAGVCG
jgi:hypothetical protein